MNPLRWQYSQLGGVKIKMATIGSAAEGYDPDAVDGDNDGIVQEGTSWERPASPRAKKLGAEARAIRDFMSSNKFTTDDLADAIDGGKTPRGKKLAEELGKYDPASARGAMELLSKPKAPDKKPDRLTTIADRRPGAGFPTPTFSRESNGPKKPWEFNGVNTPDPLKGPRLSEHAGENGFEDSKWNGKPALVRISKREASRGEFNRSIMYEKNGKIVAEVHDRKHQVADSKTFDTFEEAQQWINQTEGELHQKWPGNWITPGDKTPTEKPAGVPQRASRGSSDIPSFMSDKPDTRTPADQPETIPTALNDNIVNAIGTDTTSVDLRFLGQGEGFVDSRGAVFVATDKAYGYADGRMSVDAVRVGRLGPDGEFIPADKRKFERVLLPKDQKVRSGGSKAGFNKNDLTDLVKSTEGNQPLGWSKKQKEEFARRNGLPGPDDFDLMEKIGGPLGSQGGGWFVDADGQKFLVKPAKSEAHAQNELAAHAFYKMMGAPTDDTGIFERDGKFYIVKRAVQDDNGKLGKQVGYDGMTPKLQEEARKHFITDAIASSWDVFGINGDNVIIGPDGKLHRIDVGGSFQFRAQGAPKPGFTPDAPWVEPFTMRTSDQGRGLYGEISDAELSSMLRDAQRKFGREGDTIGKLDERMKVLGIDSTTRDAITSTLRGRADQIPEILENLRNPDAGKVNSVGSMATSVRPEALDGIKRSFNASLGQMWDDLSMGRITPRPLTSADGTSRPSWGFHASTDGSALAYIAPFGGLSNDRGDIAVAVIRQDGNNVDIPDVFVLRGEKGQLDAESTKILTDILGDETMVGSPGQVSGYHSDDFIRSFVGDKPEYLNMKGKPDPVAENLAQVSDLLEADTTPFSREDEMALSKAWSAANPTSKVGSNDFPADPFNPALSNGQLEQSGAIDKELWKAQYENLQDYFKSEVGKLPDWSSLKRRDLEDIMKRFSSYNKPDRTKTEAMLALLAHYQWLYAKD